MLTPLKRAVFRPGERIRRMPLGLPRGLNMRIDFARGQVRLFLGLYEIELNKHLRRLCRPGFCAFDVGGQFGYDSLLFANLSRAPVICLECDPDLCKEIQANVDLNPDLQPLVEVREAFVCDSDDSVDKRITLDALAAETFAPDFIKMDIEGGELAALQGAECILNDHRPNLLIEVHSSQLEADCLCLLREHGYDPQIVDQRRWLREARPLKHNRWLIAEGRR